ncbi:MAG: antitoxin [Brevibacterium aurantiacum]|nr:antitoxin [Brevibacterium aurantiacum]
MGLSSYIEKVKDVLRGRKGQQFLDKAESAASKATGGSHDDKIKKARDAANRAISPDDDRPVGRR